MKRLAFVTIIAVTVTSAPGCATYAPYGGLPTLADQATRPPDTAPYRIQVGDTVAVRFYRNPELNQDVIVRPDGYISLPFVDDVKVAGRTPAEVDEDLTKRYRGELAVPDISVLIGAFGGQRIYIGGEVGAEGVHDLAGGTTLYMAIDQAGGFLDTAHRRQVVLIRRGSNGKPTGHSFDLRQVEHGTDPSADVVLQPYDVVYVPKNKIANVNYFVDQYIRGLLPINPASAVRAAYY